MHSIRLLVVLVRRAAPGSTCVALVVLGVVVSQVFAGGGNSGASLTTTSSSSSTGLVPVSLGGWSVQYASAASTSWQATALTGSIHARGYFRSSSTRPRPSAPRCRPRRDRHHQPRRLRRQGRGRDEYDRTRLRRPPSVAARLRPAWRTSSATARRPTTRADAAPALSSSTAALRAGSGCTDTDSNGVDFTAAAPSPRNMASSAATCSGGTPPPTGVSSPAASTSMAARVAAIARAADDQLGAAFSGDTPTPVSERRRSSATTRSAIADRPPLGIHARRAAARAREHRAYRRDARPALAGGARALDPVADSSSARRRHGARRAAMPGRRSWFTAARSWRPAATRQRSPHLDRPVRLAAAAAAAVLVLVAPVLRATRPPVALIASPSRRPRGSGRASSPSRTRAPDRRRRRPACRAPPTCGPPARSRRARVVAGGRPGELMLRPALAIDHGGVEALVSAARRPSELVLFTTHALPGRGLVRWLGAVVVVRAREDRPPPRLAGVNVRRAAGKPVLRLRIANRAMPSKLNAACSRARSATGGYAMLRLPVRCLLPDDRACRCRYNGRFRGPARAAGWASAPRVLDASEGGCRATVTAPADSVPPLDRVERTWEDEATLVQRNPDSHRRGNRDGCRR